MKAFMLLINANFYPTLVFLHPKLKTRLMRESEQQTDQPAYQTNCISHIWILWNWNLHMRVPFLWKQLPSNVDPLWKGYIIQGNLYEVTKIVCLRKMLKNNGVVPICPKSKKSLGAITHILPGHGTAKFLQSFIKFEFDTFLMDV